MTSDFTILLAVLALALATVPVYALSAARSKADPHYWVGGLLLTHKRTIKNRLMI